jgi:hypothetical protein
MRSHLTYVFKKEFLYLFKILFKAAITKKQIAFIFRFKKFLPFQFYFQQ